MAVAALPKGLNRQNDVADTGPLSLIAPFTKGRPQTWPWVNRRDEKRYNLYRSDDLNGAFANWKEVDPTYSQYAFGITYGQVLERYVNHPETKSAADDGTVCGAKTRGLLRRRELHLTSIIHIRKEAKLIEEAEHGLLDSWPYALYGESTDDVTFVLERMRVSEIQRLVGCGERQAKYLHTGQHASRVVNDSRIVSALAAYVSEQRE
jgi:hypothetical protein